MGSGWDDDKKKRIIGEDPDSPVTVSTDGLKTRLDVSMGLAVMPGFNVPPYDHIEASYPDTVTEIYVYKLSGSTVCTITVVYTDATKEFILTADKT
jgi:hypothetical protein